jgi:signal transduction histidine kinase
VSDLKGEIERRLDFVGYTEADRRLLGDLRPLLEREAERLVAAFYRHLLSFDATRRLLADPEVKERLLRKQRTYLLSLGGSAVDEVYLEERIRIGDVHERVGLEPRYYLGAYALYFSLLAPLVCEELRAQPQRAERTLQALMRVLMLDAQLAMEAYIHRRERQLEFLNEELAATGQALALEVQVQTDALRATSDRARAAEDLASVATLVTGLAHEIGTPMGVIRGHAEALEDAAPDDRSRWRVRTIVEQIDRISEIIRTLLSVARPREPERSPVDLRALLDGTLAFLSEKFRRRRIRAVTEFEPVPSILGDADKLQQVVLNLCLNACDAMPEGGTLRVSLARGAEDRAVLRVADDGVGIAPDDLLHVFDPFFTTKPTGEGTGLGLAVARRIVRDHGGAIHATSEPGRGTEFRITLPLAGRQPDAKA